MLLTQLEIAVGNPTLKRKYSGDYGALKKKMEAINWNKIMYIPQEEKVPENITVSPLLCANARFVFPPPNSNPNRQLIYFDQKTYRLPEAIVTMYADRVQHLDLSHNKLSSFDALERFPYLVELVLDNNYLTDEIIFPAQLNNVKLLSLNNNKVSDGGGTRKIAKKPDTIRIATAQNSSLSCTLAGWLKGYHRKREEIMFRLYR